MTNLLYHKVLHFLVFWNDENLLPNNICHGSKLSCVFVTIFWYFSEWLIFVLDYCFWRKGEFNCELFNYELRFFQLRICQLRITSYSITNSFNCELRSMNYGGGRSELVLGLLRKVFRSSFPISTGSSPLTAHRSPLTAYRSPLTAYRSLLSAHLPG